jgi:hypothetical protein
MILTHEAYLKLLPVAICTMMVYRYVRALATSTLKYRHPERSSYSLSQSPSVSALWLATPGRLPKKAPRKIAVIFANMPEKGEAPSSSDSSDDGIMKPKEGNQGLSAEEQTSDKEEDNSWLSFRTTPPRSSIRGFIQRWKSEQCQHWEEHKRTLEVYHQALYYPGSFYLTHGWLTTNCIVQLSLGSSVFGCASCLF